MFQTLKKKLKDQRGLTLIELLAVIVILAIIAAIAIPSILGLLENSKKDAHVANAEQMVSAARNAVASNDITWPAATPNTTTLTLGDLISKGYIERFKDPTDSAGYEETGTNASKVTITKSGKDLTYQVYLRGKGGTVHINVDSQSLERGIVTP